jgi:hypothetical protein
MKYNPRLKGQKPTCSYCHILGHDVLHCPTKKAEAEAAKLAAARARAAHARAVQQGRREAQQAEKLETDTRKTSKAREVLTERRELAKLMGLSYSKTLYDELESALARGEIGLRELAQYGCSLCGSPWHKLEHCSTDAYLYSLVVAKKASEVRSSSMEAESQAEAEIKATVEQYDRRKTERTHLEEIRQMQRQVRESELEAHVARFQEEAMREEYEREFAKLEKEERHREEITKREKEASKLEMESLKEATKLAENKLEVAAIKMVYEEGNTLREASAHLGLSPREITNIINEYLERFGKIHGIEFLEHQDFELEDLED